MKKYINLKWMSFVLFFLAGVLVVSCSDNKGDDSEIVPPQNMSYYALLTGDMTKPPYAGFVTTYPENISGAVNNIKEGSLAMQTNGMRYYGEWLFKRTSLGNEGGKDEIVRYVIDASGKVQESGRIVSAAFSNYYIYNETMGYYVDVDRSLLKIQTFNPSTMRRTGEIDLTSLRNEKYKYQDVGTNLIVGKEGKLFVDIYYSETDVKGNFISNRPLGFVEVAVIDIATSKYEKTIRNNNISYIGYPGNENQMWTLGDDGGLYFCSHGFGATGAINGSAIVRIPKGQTDFDASWIIKSDDYIKNTTMGAVCVNGGKLYVQIGSQALTFPGMTTDVIYDYYQFDTENLSKRGQKIEGIPQTTYAFQCAQTIIAMDGKVYFRVVNNADRNGYYSLDKNGTVTQAFNVSSGGVVWGFAKLSKKIT